VALGNCFQTREQVEHARDKITEVLLTFHQEHATPRIAKLLIRTV
jgi:hypothetical protein